MAWAVMAPGWRMKRCNGNGDARLSAMMMRQPLSRIWHCVVMMHGAALWYKPRSRRVSRSWVGLCLNRALSYLGVIDTSRDGKRLGVDFLRCQ